MNTLQGEALREPLADGTLAEAMYLYDQKRKKPQPIYSRRIIGLLAVIGVLGFAATGFLGYPSDTSVLYTIFHPPWLLFAWFAAAILLTQRALFRQHNLTKWRWGTFIVTLVCIAGIAASYVWPDVVKDLTNGIVAVFSAIGIPLGKGRLVGSAVNFGLIALYIYDRITLWIRGRRAEYVNFWDAPISRQAFPGQAFSPPVQPDRWELIAQDLFAGAALCAALGLILQDAFLNVVSDRLLSTHVDSCEVSWIIGACQSGAANNPPTLTSIDFHIVIFAGTASVLILAIGLIASAIFQAKDEANRRVTRSVAEIIWSVINPIHVVFRNLRNVVWPVLVFGGVFSAAAAARYIRLYLHAQSDQSTCLGSPACPDLKEFAPDVARSLTGGRLTIQALQFDAQLLALAATFGILAVFTILLAARVLASSRIPVSLRNINLDESLIFNWLRFFVSSARTILLVFWLFSFGLSGLMVALQSVNVTSRVPFPQPGVSTIISGAFFLSVAIPLTWRYFRGRFAL